MQNKPTELELGLSLAWEKIIWEKDNDCIQIHLPPNHDLKKISGKFQCYSIFEYLNWGMSNWICSVGLSDQKLCYPLSNNCDQLLILKLGSTFLGTFGVCLTRGFIQDFLTPYPMEYWFLLCSNSFLYTYINLCPTSQNKGILFFLMVEISVFSTYSWLVHYLVIAKLNSNFNFNFN